MKAVQKFTPEYLQLTRKMKREQIAQFLEEFRQIHGESQNSGKSKLISIKIPESLLSVFRTKCKLSGVRYQTQIKQLMVDWLAR